MKKFLCTTILSLILTLAISFTCFAEDVLCTESSLELLDDTYILMIPLGSTGEDLKLNFTGNVAGTDGTLKSGDIFTVSGKTYTVAIAGDVNGDGKVTSVDYISIKKNFSGSMTLSGYSFVSADVSYDGKIGSVDYLRVKQYFAGRYDLYEGMNIYPVDSERLYTGPFSEENGTFGGVDDLGRELLYDTQSGSSAEKEVGVFYFMAQGQHGSTLKAYDNNLIVLNNPNATRSDADWLAAGGGPIGLQHFWGKPIFGYYTSNDTWVMRKQVEMLVATGVDYIIIDATNGFIYAEQSVELFKILKEYKKQGIDVPKVAYYTNTNSAATVMQIYSNIYARYGRVYDELFYKVDGKPLIIGEEATVNVPQGYFYYRLPQWPNAALNGSGFPWMEFTRWCKPTYVYNLSSTQSMMSVSPAQHNQTCEFSATAWYGYNDRSRSYGHKAAGLTKEEGMLAGTNYSVSWDYAISQDVENVFITGFNEWVAGRMEPHYWTYSPISFVDCADPDTSRDIEPMDGILKDNYLMQTANYIKKFKKADARVDTGKLTTIDINGDFAQWDNVTAKYSDFKGDAIDRLCDGFGERYINQTARNDIVSAKVCMDRENIYFYVETAEDIKGLSSKSFMNLYLRSKGSDTVKEDSWEGFDYAVNRENQNNGKMLLEKSKGGYNWEAVCEVQYKIEGNKMVIAVKKESLGIDKKELVDIQFKWTDNTAMNGNIMECYTNGDAAPYGRYTYIFSQVKK